MDWFNHLKRFHHLPVEPSYDHDSNTVSSYHYLNRETLSHRDQNEPFLSGLEDPFAPPPPPPPASAQRTSKQNNKQLNQEHSKVLPSANKSERLTRTGAKMLVFTICIALLAIVLWGVEQALDSKAKQLVALFVAGILMSAGFFYQFKIIVKESRERRFPIRLKPAGVLALIMIVGAIFISIMRQVDPQSTDSFEMATEFVLKVGILGMCLLLKSYLAPLTAAFTLTSTTYYYFYYGEIRALPLVQTIIDWALSSPQNWISWGYITIVFFGTLGVSIYELDTYERLYGGFS